ncbi:viroplasmin family protein [Clostridium manihotivorum]|uniref:Ribonuclease HI n=1 Tax=Clostridium manihotivorum TaxID=2320868 RepID=A0A3R5X476_9CLOT|nr:ribonuclease H family protein [Clostridium manihotivorum]QAA34171.1 ribonuclease HI [Clostridium manihotivorum]
MGKKVYAIKEGFDFSKNEKVENIIVNTWDQCLKLVKGVKGAKYKSFESLEEARKFLDEQGNILKKGEHEYPMDCLHAYVDGSYNISTEEYAYGVVAVRDNVVEYIDSGVGKSSSEKNIRQIAGELEAAVKAAEYALSIGEKKMVLFHDYAGICYHATGFWERKDDSSKQYHARMNEIMSKGLEVIFVKVDSHTGDFFNELVDEKCKEKLGIASEKVVSRWLSSNTLKVSNETIKREIERLSPKHSENIIVDGEDNTKVSMDSNKSKIQVPASIIDIIEALPEGKQEEIISYAKKVYLDHFNKA